MSTGLPATRPQLTTRRSLILLLGSSNPPKHHWKPKQSILFESNMFTPVWDPASPAFTTVGALLDLFNRMALRLADVCAF
eukprot:12438240-Heterocapsa_arctica.AAC.1